jgi:NAD-dependent deacetylase
VEEADLLLVAGSSLEVAPISDLPFQALEQNTKIIIINFQETYIDDRADVVIRQDLTEVLPEIVRLALN